MAMEEEEMYIGSTDYETILKIQELMKEEDEN